MGVVIEHIQPPGLAVARGYSHVTAGSGRLIAVSGQLPVTDSGEVIGDGDGLAQARQVFANLARALHSAGADFGDVLRLTVYLTDLGDLGSVRTAREEHLGDGPYPASTLVQVAGLAVAGARIEIDALAVTDA